MSGVNYRTFRITKDGLLKMNAYCDNDRPKKFKSYSYTIDTKIFHTLGLEGSFILCILNTIYSGGYFKADNLMQKYNLINNIFNYLDSKNINWVDIVNSFTDSNQNLKNNCFIEHINSIARENSSIINKFIRK